MTFWAITMNKIQTLAFASIATLAGVFLSSAAVAAAGEMTVDNFKLIDHTGEARELYYERDAKAVVLIVQGNSCPIVRNLITDFNALQADYAEQGVEVLMLNSNLQDTRESIAKEAAEWNIEVPILHDSAQLVGRSLELSRTAEVLVIDPSSWSVVYRGAVDAAGDAVRNLMNDQPVTQEQKIGRASCRERV